MKTRDRERERPKEGKQRSHKQREKDLNKRALKLISQNKEELKQDFRLSKKRNKEYVRQVIEHEGELYLSPPTVGQEGNVNVKSCPVGTREVARVHTHPETAPDYARLSAADLASAISLGLSISTLATRDGLTSWEIADSPLKETVERKIDLVKVKQDDLLDLIRHNKDQLARIAKKETW